MNRTGVVLGNTNGSVIDSYGLDSPNLDTGGVYCVDRSGYVGWYPGDSYGFITFILKYENHSPYLNGIIDSACCVDGDGYVDGYTYVYRDSYGIFISMIYNKCDIDIFYITNSFYFLGGI